MNDLKSKLEPIRRAIDAALVQIAKDHGLQSLKSGKCGYDPRAGNFTIKVEGVDGEGITSEAARHDRHESSVQAGRTMRERALSFQAGSHRAALQGGIVIFEFDVLSTSGQLSKVTVKADTEALAYPQLFRQIDAHTVAEARVSMIAAPEASEEFERQTRIGLEYLRRKLAQ